MEGWTRILKEGIDDPDEASKRFGLDPKLTRKVAERFPIRINSYFLSLIKSADDPIGKQVVPDPRELDEEGYEDPLNEEEDSPVPNLVHRYPDRVVLFVSHQCPIYCRFCTRRRKVGRPASFSPSDIGKGIEYIRSHREIRDVTLSGGDPLMLSDRKLEGIIRDLRAIPHVEIIRIGTRVPCALPQRVTGSLCSMLRKYHPIYMNIHFNHPDEITPESAKACEMLADAGIPLGSQTVLLRGVNDDPETMKLLMQKLLTIRVRPYYIFHMDLVKGTAHFRTSIRKGMEIMRAIQGFTSGLCLPHYVLDTPGGGGKVPIYPDYIISMGMGRVVLKNYEGRIYVYPDIVDEPVELKRCSSCCGG
jgi:lysine 2,3-aminomutase